MRKDRRRGASPVQEEQVREKEGERLLKQMKDDAYTVTLEMGGDAGFRTAGGED